jgi:hypothetical protein
MVDPAKGAEETLALNALGIIREGDASDERDEDWRIFRGKYRDSVSRHDFFVTVGRPDLDRRQSSRQGRHSAFVVGGVGGIIVGAWLVGASFSKGGFDPHPAVGAGLMVAGLISFLWISEIFSGPDLKVDEAEGLVRRYNERLRDHLQPPADPASHIQAVRSLHVAPWIAPGSGGLAAAARF